MDNVDNFVDKYKQIVDNFIDKFINWGKCRKDRRKWRSGELRTKLGMILLK